MPSGGTINVNLVAQIAAFEAHMKRAEGMLHSFGGTAKSVTHLAEAFLGYEAIKHVAEWIHHTIEAAEKTTKLADSLGISTEALTQLGFSAKITGVGTEALGAAMLKMEKNLSGIGGESGKAKAALEAMGMSMRDMQGKNADEQFRAIAAGMQNLHTSADRAKVSIDLFGRSGASLLPLLTQSTEKMEAQAKEAEDLGISFSRVDGAKIEEANQALIRGGEALQGGLLQVAKELAPIITEIINYLLAATKSAGGFGVIAHEALTTIFNDTAILIDATNVLGSAYNAMKVGILVMGIGILEVFEQFAALILTDVELIKQFTKAFGETGRYLDREWFVVWQHIKIGVSTAVQYMGEKFAELLDVISSGMRTYSDTLADSIATAAGKVRISTGHMAGDSKEAMATLVQDAEFAGKRMGEAWSAVGNMGNAITENPMLVSIRATQAKMDKAAEESAVQFIKTFAKVINQDGSIAFKEWLAHIEQISQQHAEEEANAQEQKLENDRAMAAAELSIDQYRADEEKRMLNQEILDENEAYQKRLNELKRYHDEALLSDAEFKQAEADATKKHSHALADLTIHDEQRVTKWEQMNNHEKIASVSNTLGNIATLMHSHSKRAFEIGKVAAYAQTVVNTAEGAMAAYAQMCGTGPWGFIYGAVAAAAVVAAGAVQLSQIRSQTFDGGGGGASSAGFSAGGGAIDMAGVNAQGPGQGAPVFDSRGPTVQIDIHGISDDGVYSGKFLRNLVEHINRAQTDGSTLDQVGTV